jgi:hypothetical protein
MLGEFIGQSSGKRSGRRILGTEPVTVEVSFEATGRLLGVDVAEIGTYASVIRSDGTLYGEGEGVLISAEGETLTWKGGGVGALGEGGAVSYRGAIYLYSTSPKFSRLNKVATVFEFGVDAAGNTTSQLWEWK